MKINKLNYKIGILFILLLILFSYINNNILIQIYPENNSIITERQPTFKWIGKANKLIIDDNNEFISPIIENIDGNPYRTKNRLNFTTYYWRLLGDKNSSVWQFTVQSLVALTLKNQSSLYNVSNVGNTDLEIEIHQKNKSLWKITGNLILEQNKTKQIEVENSTLFVAKQR